ncbi:unnamed protein product [Durusdinium trenchii]|uniref:Phytanoyl-CoA dioxygenase n=1 Tax=Durusdinium trenchii TaxID=1381693 RepID=A0ABP0NAG3_9DINO
MAPVSPRFVDVTTFAVEEEAAYTKHFREQGFVVVRDVLNASEVQETIDEIWSCHSLLGGGALDRKEPRSWDAWPGGSRNFVESKDPTAELQTWRNRVNGTLNRVFDVLWESFVPGASEGLVMSVDRLGLMRPTLWRETETETIERPEWRTSRDWLHWDQNPWAMPEFEAMQGFISLSGSRSSGGFVTVPEFQQHFAQWSKDHPEGSIPKRSKTMIPFPVPLEDEMQARRCKIVVPSGGLLVWDSRLPHENFPNTGEDWRVVQYVTCKRLSPADVLARATAWQNGLRTGLIPCSFAQRYTAAEQLRLGMTTEDTTLTLETAVKEGENLSEEQREAAQKLKRAYRLKQSAELPDELKEAVQLFREAFEVNPELREVLQQIGRAESSYLPFWII